MANKLVKINRAPVLTLWAAVVAERLGHKHDAALTLGKVVAGLNAQSKGRRLGIFDDSKDSTDKEKSKARKQDDSVALLGRSVPVLHTKEGVRATVKGKPVDPDSVERYVAQKFGEDLPDVRAAMKALAKAFTPKKLADQAYALYEEFRPSIPEGAKGWGARGVLDLELIRSLARSNKQ